MKRLLALPFALCATISLGSATALAHETWLLPDNFSPAAGDTVQFLMTSGMGFPALGSAIAAERVVAASLLRDEQRDSLAVHGVRESALELRATVGEGASCAWVQLRPRILEIPEHDDIRHYLEEIGAPDTVWDHWSTEAGESLWRESYSKLARSYLRTQPVGKAIGCIAAPAASRFDIRPLADPTRLAAGDSLPLALFFDGVPLSGQSVGVVREGGEPHALRRSGADGRLEVTLQRPGRYMVYATNLRPADAETFNWESDFVTLTFEVGE